MPSSFHTSLFITLILITTPSITPTLARFHLNISQVLLNQICNKTKVPSTCLQSLQSDRRTATADLLGLEQVAIDLAKATARDNLGAINFLLNKTRDPEIISRAQLCLDAYNLATHEIDSAVDGLKAKDFGAVNSAGQGCLTHAHECLTGFKPYPPFLPHENDKLYTSCQVVIDVATLLSSKS